MNKKHVQLSVTDKISAVIALHNSQFPGVRLSISSLATQAGVSRANLYVSHSDVISSLKRPKGEKSESSTAKQAAKTADLLEELKAVKKANKALLLLNDALRNENRRLKQRLTDMAPQKNRRS